jgi:hypothetical protein
MELTALWAQARDTTLSAEDVTLALYATRITQEAAMYGLDPLVYVASIAEEETRQIVAQHPDLTATVQQGLFADALTVDQYRAGRAILSRARLVTARLRRWLGAIDSPPVKGGEGWAALRCLPPPADE